MTTMSVRRAMGLVWCAVMVGAGLVIVAGPAAAVEGTWEQTGSLNVPRQNPTSTLLDNGRVLVAGGRNFVPNDALESAELYNPLTETFSVTGSMANARWSHTATKLPNGRVLVTGGFTDPTTGANAQPVLNSAELYDPASGTWTPTAPMSVRRALHAATLLPNGKVLVAGGRTCNAAPPTACNFTFTTNTAEIYDPATGAFSPAAPMSSARHTTSAVRVGGGKVLVPAGFPGGQNTAERYDVFANAWIPTGNLSIPRARQGAMQLPNGQALVAAGAIGGPPPLSSETYDPLTNSWTLAGNLAQTRFNYLFTELPNGKVLAAGGAPGTTGGPAETTAEVFDPVSRTWSSAGTIPNPHGTGSSLGNTTRIAVLSFHCGENCGKALVVGDNPDGTAELYSPAFGCTTTVTGTVASVNAPGGSVVCIAGAFVTGAVTVQPGGSLVALGARVNGGILSTGAASVRTCGGQIRNGTGGPAISVVGSTGPVVIGDGSGGCARNDIVGLVSFDGNLAVEFDTNRVSGSVSVANTSGSPVPSVIAFNQITGNLTCTNNTPVPTDEGWPNIVLGTVTGCFPAPIP